MPSDILTNSVDEVRNQAIQRLNERVDSVLNEKLIELEQQSVIISQVTKQELERLQNANHARELMLHSEMERLAKAEEDRQKKYDLELAKLQKVSQEREAILEAYSLEAVIARTTIETRINSPNGPISIVEPLVSQAITSTSLIDSNPILKKSETQIILKY